MRRTKEAEKLRNASFERPNDWREKKDETKSLEKTLREIKRRKKEGRSRFIPRGG